MRQFHVQLTNEAAAYLAGLVDGEGCLNFYRGPNKSCTKGYTYIARMSITNCDLATLVALREELGIGRVSQKTPTPRRKPAYQLTFYAREVRLLLPYLLPYLRIKRKQAEIVLAFVNRQRWGGQKGGLSAEEHALREQEHMRLRELNRRWTETVVN